MICRWSFLLLFGHEKMCLRRELDCVIQVVHFHSKFFCSREVSMSLLEKGVDIDKD